VLDDVRAVELLIEDERAGLLVVELEVLGLARRAAALDDEPDGVRRSLRGVRDAAGDEERLALADADVADRAVLDDPTQMSPSSWKKYSSEFVQWKSLRAFGPPTTITKKSSPS